MSDPPKPTLFRGQPIQFLDLTPKEMETFLYAAMAEVGPLHGIRVTAGPSESSDSGFDSIGERIVDKKAVCFQCKRLAAPFTLGMLGTELAKVGLRSALEGSDVAEHFIVVASAVAQAVRSALRKTERSALIAEATHAAEHDDDLKTLRKKARERGLEPRVVVEEYVRKLEKIEVWSGRDFDGQLGRVWSRILPILERYFSLVVVLREHPRPDFNRAEYLKMTSAEAPPGLLSLRASRDVLPPNLSRSKGEDPLADGLDGGNQESKSENAGEAVDLLLQTAPGVCVVLHGRGGSGKTTTLKQTARVTAEQAKTDEEGEMPVYIHLGGYQGSLRELIHARLRITYGSWTSLPHRWVLFLDGLDEVPSLRVQPLLDELELIVRDGFVRCVLTVRSGGLRHPAALSELGPSLRLLPLTVREVIDLAESRIAREQREKFLDQLRAHLKDLWRSLLFMPFGFSTAMRMFAESGMLPADSQTLLSGFLKFQLHRNRQRSNVLEDRLRDVPDTAVLKLAECVAFELRVARQRSSATAAEVEEIVARALAVLKDESQFGLATLSDTDAYALLRHYEFLEPTGDGRVRLPHDIVADFLAAPRLARAWTAHLTHLESTVGQDAWFYASSLIPPAQRQSFLEVIAGVDPIQAAYCARSMDPAAVNFFETFALALDEKNTRISTFQASSCLAILGTPTCLARLRARLASYPETSNRHFQAQRALVLGSDLVTLTAILEAEEPSVSTGISVSGGAIDLWYEASPDVTLPLARARLDAIPENPRVVLSLRTVEMYGDETDVSRVRTVLEKASDLPAFYAAARSLLVLDRADSITYLKARAASLPPREQRFYAEVLSSADAKVDTTPLLNELLAAPAPKDTQEAEFRRRVVRVAAKEELPAGYSERLRAAFDAAHPDLRRELWELATAHRLPEFDALALETLSKGADDETGMAANFAKARGWSPDEHARATRLCLERAGAAEGTEWMFPRLLEYLVEQGKSAEVLTLLEPRLRTMIPRHKSLHSKVLDAVSRGEVRADAESIEEFQLAMVIPPLVEIAASVAADLAADVAVEILGADLSTTGDEPRSARASIARGLSARELDAVLEGIDNPYIQMEVLAGISDLPPTPVRVGILRREIGRVLLWPAGIKYLTRAVENFWSREVAEVAVEAIAAMKWPDYGSQIAREFVTCLAVFGPAET